MGQWTDLFLNLPLPQVWMRALLFVTFGLHLLFVLLMLGTAMLGLTWFLPGWFSGKPGQPWEKRVVHSHLGLKSLAVVLGVGPLLLLQVSNSFAFFTTTGIFGYTWLAVIPLLILAFLFIDGFGHHMDTGPFWAFLLGVLGVGLLLTVPAIFTGALSLMERPQLWAKAAGGFGWMADYTPHWILRYLHILGAAVIFGAAFHLFFTSRDNPEKAAAMRQWILAGTLFQVVVGVPLLFTVADALSWPVLAAVTLGAAAAMAVLWGFRPRTGMQVREMVPELGRGRVPRGAVQLFLLLPVVFVAMLAARQYLQDDALAEVHELSQAQRAEASAKLAKYDPQALAAFQAKLNTVYDNGATIYEKSCAPCHGEQGLGDGFAARKLLVPAEVLADVRADRDYIHAVLAKGVPGSAMPYFTLFDRTKLDSLLDELEGSYGMFDQADSSVQQVGAEATRLWETTCATCHGQDGSVADFGRTLRPEPPDLTRFVVQPERALAVISDGYPGTVMQPYRHLPIEVRQDLVALSLKWRTD